MGFFNFVEQDHRVWLSSHPFGELTAVGIVVTDISRGRAYELGYGVLFHKLRHIHTNHKPFVAEHRFRKRFCKVGFTYARRTYEDETAYRFIGFVKPRAGAAYGSCYG